MTPRRPWLDALLTSGTRFTQSVLLLSAHAKGQLPTITTRRIGPALVFQRLWQETGCQSVICHRLNLYQMIVGAVLDGQGRPICCELWSGNTTDVKTLIPVVDRLPNRFELKRVCIVADRGMISLETIEALEHSSRDWQYILGARMRSQNEVKDEVISQGGRCWVVHLKQDQSKAPSPLKLKEVWVEDRQYIVCLNENEAREDPSDREAIVTALREQLRHGDKSLVGNKGYRRYLSTEGPGISRSTRRRWPRVLPQLRRCGPIEAKSL